MTPRRIDTLVILGALTAFAPLGVDMYLPAFPALERAFATTPGAIQGTLASFFLGFALGQGFFGPLADRFGRKKPLYAGLGLFALASIGCAYAPSVEWLTGLRFVQAIGACAGGVVARAMVRDLYTPREAAGVFATLMLVMGLAPILAPLLGGYLFLWLGWESIFWALALIGLACIAAVALRLPETHRAENVRPLAFGPVLRGYRALLGHRAFVARALAGGFSFAGLFTYIAGSPHVFITLNGIAPEHYGWLFGANAFGLIMVSQTNRWLVRRFPLATVLRGALSVQCFAGLGLLTAAVTGLGGLAGLFVFIMLYCACIGLVGSNATALAMAPFAENAGAASGLLGMLQFSLGAVMSTAMGAMPGATAIPFAATVAVCGILGLTTERVLTPAAQR